MALIAPLLAVVSTRSMVACSSNSSSFFMQPAPVGLVVSKEQIRKKRSLTVVSAVGDVSADGTVYLIAGAATIALLGTAFPAFFSRKDLCPECDGAGFVRESGSTLQANAARKDQAQIVCIRCNGLGKLGQIDK
ncbi:hypothetical protein GIB67_034009 [Kingdonia uniflora]|uniref:Uncharacterized protein n=1 Tax=Kingdonia uniflora TaxID=39325 RepID=A0A7J7M674_9MAGN|nr:hypothetical protein GIB67_034009 [Kingdonia uniflora]